MEAYKHLMAKSDQEDDSLWLPLWMHLKDTAGVMKKLVHRWIPQSVVNASGLDFEEFEKTAVFTAAVHDIGKATCLFQSNITIKNNLKRDELEDAGFKICNPKGFPNKKGTPHSYAGQWILQSKTAGFNIERTICDVVGAHHGKPISSPRQDLLQFYEENFYGEGKNDFEAGVWENAWNNIVEEALKIAGINSTKDLPKLSIQAQVLLSGLLITADWIASNVKFFPLIDIEEIGSEEFYPERIEEGYKELEFPRGWMPGIAKISDKQFQERFGFLPNQVQKAMIQVVEGCGKPGIFILEAQMGVGKTEAALAAAELLASKDELGGVFFGLPTQSTSNGLFPRLYEWADSLSEDTVNSIRLAHGAAEFNDDYEKLIKKGESFVDNEEGEDGGLEVHPWFQGNKTALLSNFVIGTVDQFLMVSLKRKHFMMRHLGLAGKVIIIDECHAYDTYMNVYLDRSIQWMAAYGIPIILLSATLPGERREKLIKCYKEAYLKYNLKSNETTIRTEDEKWKKNTSYPILTWTDGEKICQKSIDQDVKEEEIQVEKIGSLDEMIFLLDESLKEGGCACVIMNTVKEAQKVYQRISADMEDADVLLYHAQFIMPDRAKKEKELLNHMGKNSRESDRRRYILIGTQVLEQSLDYDADIMVTQLCPMDLLLQRMGRLHRHDRERPELLKNPKFVILTDGDEPYDEGTKAVYGDYLLQKTWLTICNKKNTEGNVCFLLPEEIPVLVQDVYSDQNDKIIAEDISKEAMLQDEKDGTVWDSERTDFFENAKQEYDKKQKDKKKLAGNYLLKKPMDTIEKILVNSDSKKEENAESRVRDGTFAVEVIVMKREASGTITFLDDENGKIHLSPYDTPDNYVGRLIARQRINLPHIFSLDWNIKQTIGELEDQNKRNLPSWQQSTWLKGELILLLDEERCANLCGYQITYSKEMGLMYMKEEERDGGKGI